MEKTTFTEEELYLKNTRKTCFYQTVVYNKLANLIPQNRWRLTTAIGAINETRSFKRL